MVFFAVDLHGCRRYPLVCGAERHDEHQSDEMAAAEAYMQLHSLVKPESGALFVGADDQEVHEPFLAALKGSSDSEDLPQTQAVSNYSDLMGYAGYEAAADTTTSEGSRPCSTEHAPYEPSSQSLFPDAAEALAMNVHPWCMLAPPAWYVQPAALDDVLEASADSSSSSLTVMMPVQPESSTTAAATASETQCWACGRSFMNKTSLARHRRAVHGPRVWHVCEVCGKALATRQSLAAHALKHSGRRPFSCSLCGAGFLRRNSLRHHLFVKHGGQDADVTDGVVQQHDDVGVQVVHQRASSDGGGIVFQRAAGGGVVGVLTTPASPASPVDAAATPRGHGEDRDRQDKEGDDGHFLESPGIVMRLVRCGDPDVWRIEDLWQGPEPGHGAAGAEPGPHGQPS